MPYPKDRAKMTGDTHLPDVESGMYDEGSADAARMDETVRERGARRAETPGRQGRQGRRRQRPQSQDLRR
jgi:hypothetical protein